MSSNMPDNVSRDDDNDTQRLKVEDISPDTGAAPSEPIPPTRPYTLAELVKLHELVTHPDEPKSQLHFLPEFIREEDLTISTKLILNDALLPQFNWNDKITLDSKKLSLGGDVLASVLAHLSETFKDPDASDAREPDSLTTQVWSAFTHVMREKSKWPSDLRLVEDVPLFEEADSSASGITEGLPEDQSSSAGEHSVIEHRPSIQVETDRCTVQCRSGASLNIKFDPSLPQDEVDESKEYIQKQTRLQFGFERMFMRFIPYALNSRGRIDSETRPAS